MLLARRLEKVIFFVYTETVNDLELKQKFCKQTIGTETEISLELLQKVYKQTTCTETENSLDL
jgi:hypothetical protein